MGSFLLFKMQNKTKHLPGPQSMEQKQRGLLPHLPEVLFFVMIPWGKREADFPRLRKFPQLATALLPAQKYLLPGAHTPLRTKPHPIAPFPPHPSFQCTITCTQLVCSTLSAGWRDQMKQQEKFQSQTRLPPLGAHVTSQERWRQVGIRLRRDQGLQSH